MSNNSIWYIGKTLSGVTSPDQSWAGSNGNEWVLKILQMDTKNSHHRIVYCHIQDARCEKWSYPSAEMQSVHSLASADWASHAVKK